MFDFITRYFSRNQGQGPFGPLSLTQWEEMQERGLFGSSRTDSGVSVNATTAQNHAAVHNAVYLISTQFACLPCWLYERLDPIGKKRLTTPLSHLLHDEPNPLMTQQVMSEAMCAHMLLRGNAYAEIERDNSGNPIGLWLLTPDRVTPKFIGEDLYYEVKSPNDSSEAPAFIPARNMLHVPYITYNGIEGISVIEHARNSIGLGLAAQEFASRFFGNGAQMGGMVTDPSNIVKPDQVERVKKLIADNHSGLKNSWRTGFLPHGLKWDAIGFNAKDLEFLALRQYQDVEVCRWFNIQPTKLKDMTRATYSNNEQENISFGKDTLRPIVNRFKQEYKRKLVRPEDKPKTDIDFIFADLERADSKTRAEVESVYLQYGVLSPDEVRDMHDMTPRPDGKGGEYIVAQNIVGKQAPKDKPTEDEPTEDAPTRAIAAAKEIVATVTEKFRKRETDRLPRLDTDEKRSDFYARFTNELQQELTAPCIVIAELTQSNVSGAAMARDYATNFKKASNG